ncbi:MAG: glycosyltransferase, partial [Propionibacteriales bacterium]|nr:glycosyltransferase [Propionibacteriales bacterium]
LERVFAPALHITAPTPRAIELLEARTKLTGEALSNGIDPTSYRRAAEKGESEIPTVLFVGRLDQEKRVDELIKAFAQLSPDVPARLEIVGDGSCREEWKTLAQQVGLTADRVTFRGYISEEELVEAYGRCAIFCMPGIAELQSLVTLEAMAAGKPVVCADAMALPHLCRPGQNGWLYEPGDVGELTLRLSTLLGDKAMRARFGQHSQQIANRHSMADTLDRFEEIYADALGLSDFAEDTEAAA